MDRDADDPRGVIAEAYRIDGIGTPECRSIFLDWALGVSDPHAAIPRLLLRHGAADHPMTGVLRAGLDAAPPPRRRGGRAGRTDG
jgi:hypothetical protein